MTFVEGGCISTHCRYDDSSASRLQVGFLIRRDACLRVLCRFLSKLVNQCQRPSEARGRGLVGSHSHTLLRHSSALRHTNLSEHPLLSPASGTLRRYPANAPWHFRTLSVHQDYRIQWCSQLRTDMATETLYNRSYFYVGG